jgi:hypothetical protein
MRSINSSSEHGVLGEAVIRIPPIEYDTLATSESPLKGGRCDHVRAESPSAHWR